MGKGVGGDFFLREWGLILGRIRFFRVVLLAKDAWKPRFFDGYYIPFLGIFVHLYISDLQMYTPYYI